EDLHGVVLVGHSYGGAISACVADRVPSRVSQIIYIDAVLPIDGESCIDAVGVPPRDLRLLFDNEAAGEVVAIAPGHLDGHGVRDPTDRRWMEERMRPHPGQTLRDP